MTFNPLSRVLDRRKPLRPDVEQALTQLARLTETFPDMSEIAATHAALLRAVFRDVPALPPIELDPDTIVTKLEAGVPVLRGAALALDGRWLQQRYVQLTETILSAARSTAESAAQALKAAVHKGALNVHSCAVDVLAGDPHAIVERADQLDLNAELAATVLRWTLLPLLEQANKQLAPQRQAGIWGKGYCPTCGSWPLLGERRGIEQMLYLRCGLCASEWESELMACPFCGSRSHFDIAYLYDDAEEATRRAVTCERCHCYYKTVTTLAPLTAPQLTVVDLETIHLDMIALERAYGPPA